MTLPAPTDETRLVEEYLQNNREAFRLVDGFTNKAGQATLRYDAGADITYLELDVDGDGLADGVIAIAGDRTDFTNFRL